MLMRILAIQILITWLQQVHYHPVLANDETEMTILERRYRMAVKSVLQPKQSHESAHSARARMATQKISMLRKRSIVSDNTKKNRNQELYLPSVLTNISFIDVITQIPIAAMAASSADETLDRISTANNVPVLPVKKTPPQIAEQSVDVVAWMNAPGNLSSITGCVFALNRDIWVTMHPDIRNFCRRSKTSPLRLAQYLGLPPTKSLLQNRRFIRISVPLKSLFRPCLRNISDSKLCSMTSVQFKSKARPPILRYDSDGKLIGPMDSPWFYSLAVETPIYEYWQPNINSIFPWTRLGYTFDWHKWGKGADEFVIQKDTKILVKRASTFADFCRKPK